MLVKNNKGAAAIEFAIILPVLLLILFGIIEFSVAFFDKAVITNASREGARVGILFRPDPRSAASEDTEIQNIITNYIQDNLVTFGAASTATTTISRTGFGVGNALTVTVTYPYTYLVLPGFVTTLTSPVTLTATTVMNME